MLAMALPKSSLVLQAHPGQGLGLVPLPALPALPREILVPWELLKAKYLQQLPCDHPQHVALHSWGGQG